MWILHRRLFLFESPAGKSSATKNEHPISPDIIIDENNINTTFGMRSTVLDFLSLSLSPGSIDRNVRFSFDFLLSMGIVC